MRIDSIDQQSFERLVSLLPAIDATADGEAISAFCGLRDGLQSVLDGDAPDAVEAAVRYQIGSDSIPWSGDDCREFLARDKHANHESL